MALPVHGNTDAHTNKERRKARIYSFLYRLLRQTRSTNNLPFIGEHEAGTNGRGQSKRRGQGSLIDVIE